MSYYLQNDEELDYLDMFEKGEHKRPKVIVIKSPSVPKKVTVKMDWTNESERNELFKRLGEIDKNDN